MDEKGLTPEDHAALVAQIERLREEHRDLDAAIEALRNAGQVDQLQVQRLKKRKLLLRDKVAALEDRSIEVIQSRTTRDALAMLQGELPFDAVVSDMARTEDGVRHDSAGIELIAAMRTARIRIPIVIYTTAKKVELYSAAVRDAGGIGVTASSTELFELLGVNVGPRSGVRLEAEVGVLLEEAGVERLSIDPTRSGRVDMLIRWNDQSIGIEVKAWLQPPAARVLQDVLRRLGNLVSRGELDEVWLVTLRDLHLAPGQAQGVRSFTLEQLREKLSDA